MDMFSSNQNRVFSEPAIRQFLLAQRSRDDSTAFEESLFTDAAFAQRVRLAEFELADDYAFGRLPSSEKTQFEKHFLCSAARLKILRASRAFALQPHEPAKTLRPAGLRHPKVRLAFAVTLATLLLAAFWIVVKKEPRIKREIVRRLTNKSATAQPTPVESHHGVNTELEHLQTPQPLPEHAAATPRVFTVSLGPNNHETPTLVQGPAANYDLIQFDLIIGPLHAGRYAVQVLTNEGESIYEGNAEPHSASTVKFSATRSLFAPGEFEIRLVDENSGALLASYYFRVE